jgi:hypothetical protein
MKAMKFKLWKWLIPIFGLFYLIWFGWMTTIGKREVKYDGNIHHMFGRINNVVVAIIAQLYIIVHVYSFAILLAWLLSVFGLF